MAVAEDQACSSASHVAGVRFALRRSMQDAMTKSTRDTPPTKVDGIENPPGGAGREADAVPRDAATQSFIRGVVERGEAGHYDADGKLPQQYKYAVIGTHSDGLPILKRVRT